MTPTNSGVKTCRMDCAKQKETRILEDNEIDGRLEGVEIV
jgi:hypothetical protein